MIIDYCVGNLQEMVESAPEKKFPIWQAHWYGFFLNGHGSKAEFFENLSDGMQG